MRNLRNGIVAGLIVVGLACNNSPTCPDTILGNVIIDTGSTNPRTREYYQKVSAHLDINNYNAIQLRIWVPSDSIIEREKALFHSGTVLILSVQGGRWETSKVTYDIQLDSLINIVGATVHQRKSLLLNCTTIEKSVKGHLLSEYRPYRQINDYRLCMGGVALGFEILLHNGSIQLDYPCWDLNVAVPEISSALRIKKALEVILE